MDDDVKEMLVKYLQDMKERGDQQAATLLKLVISYD